MKKLLPLIVLALSPVYFGFADCGSSALTGSTAKEIGICFGRVIDRSTRAGIAGATVEIYGGAVPSKKDNTANEGSETNFVAKTATVSDDADTTLFNEAGMFRFEDLATGDATGYQVRISSTNYATMQTFCTFATASQDNTPIAEDMGDLGLVRGVSVTVNLMNNGSGVATCPIFAFGATTVDDGGGTNALLGGVEVSGTTDSSGAVTLAGLNPLIDYTIVAPACDNNADNVYDFSTALFAFDSAIDSSTTISIEANPVGRDETLALVDTNAILIVDSGDGFPTNDLVEDIFNEGAATTILGAGPTDDVLGVSSSQNILLVFNFPVSVASSPGIGLDFTNNLITSAGAGYPLPGSIDATCTLSAGDTVLTCDPGDLTVNEIYTLSGSVAANRPFGANGPANEVLNLSDLDDDGTLDGGFYVYDNSSAGVSSTSSFTADNYNASTTGGGADLVYLEFPEFVYGTWEVISTVAAGTSVSLVGAGCLGVLHTPSSFLFQANDPDTAGVVTGTASDATTAPTGTSEGSGSGAGIVYRVPLTAVGCGGDLNLNDSIAGAVNSVTLFIDATDVEGNRRQGEFTLTVQ
ncbi:MAG: hypothetical protein HY542_06210 [Deltaproteobacteria bacterium]|nr:hypothetical protein [Deltaproteobacteria bacterium]